MRWIVGIHGSRRDAGAASFGQWLCASAGGVAAAALVPVRVLEHERLRSALRYRRLEDVVEEERFAAARRLAALLPGGFAPPEVVLAPSAADGLEAARARVGAAGVIVGRAAPLRSRSPLRLGGTARRLLRRLASPIIVTPPDLAPAAMGAGPVVGVSSLGADSVAACRLARDVADGLRRDLAIVHVAGTLPRRGDGGPFAHAERALSRWIARHEVWPDLTAVVEGDVVGATLAFAEARRAPLLAIGARADRGVRDALERKAWRRLAAHAAHAVLVVPAAAEAAAVAAAGAESGSADAARR